MQDLMVHVHQVLVHESVVTPDFSVEQHRLVFLRVEPGQIGERRLLRERGIAGEHEDQPVRLVARVGAHGAARRVGALDQIGNARDRTGRVVPPRVIAALDLLAADDPLAERELPVRAAIFQREHSIRVRPDEDDRVAREGDAQRLVSLQLPGPGQRVPVVGIAGDATQIRLIAAATPPAHHRALRLHVSPRKRSSRRHCHHRATPDVTAAEPRCARSPSSWHVSPDALSQTPAARWPVTDDSLLGPTWHNGRASSDRAWR